MGVMQQPTSDGHMTSVRRWQLALILLVAGFAIVPVTVSAELALGWLSPHGDGFATALLAVLLMLALCSGSYRLLGSMAQTDDRWAGRKRFARAIAFVGVMIPLAVFALFVYLATRPPP